MFQFLIGPAVGAVIGYITNDIAIRMLFRPHQAKYFMGIHIPFTPGIIPKEKTLIASKIGKAVSENLMNHEVLEKNLLSKEMLGKINDAIDELVDTQSRNTETLEQFASHYLPPSDIEALSDNVTSSAVKTIASKLQDSTLGERIAHMAVEHVMEKTRNSIAGLLGADKIAGALAAPLEALLAKHINEILNNNAEPIVQNIVVGEVTKFKNKTMSELTRDHQQQVQQAKGAVLNAYRVIISEHLPRILQDINISAIIEDRINEMDMNEAEAIILDVMKKELRAIVWLGALLGSIMGVVTSLV